MKLKRFAAAALAACMMIGAAGCGETQGGGMRDMTANEYAKDMGIGINLGNTMEAYDATDCEQAYYTWIPKVGGNTPQDYETRWGAVVTTQEVIDGMKAEGFNTVRIPVFWGNMMEDDGTYTINEDYMNRVQEIVDYCMEAGVYAVINIHHFDEFIIRRNDLDSCKKIFNNLWTQIAEHFKDYSDYVVFEGYNEYLGGAQFDGAGVLTDLPQDDGYALTNALNQTFVDAVRATGGNNAERLLIVSGYWTNIDLTTGEKFVLPTDSAEDKLMVSVHYIDNMCYWINQIGGQFWLDYTHDQCELLKKKFTDNGIPVFVGETSANYPSERFAGDAQYTDTSECLEVLLDTATDYGFVPVIWDVNDNMYSRTDFRIKSDSDREVIQKIAEKIKG
ncbi:MAG: glycoside hydrolase family 5 protein [Eubacterium sp.]|nr:glycoside hydrolase family 5 protein [Eubacterium sp.]